MNNLEKYQLICQLVRARYPVLASVWELAHERYGENWLQEFIRNIEVVYGEIRPGSEERMQDALDGYAEFCYDSTRNQVFYEKHGHYKASNYEEVKKECYLNEDHMTRCYLPGMYLSHLLWPQHFNMLRGFRGSILPRAAAAGLFFEVGVGCGMYSKVMLESLPGIRGVGFDISQYSLDFTKNIADQFGYGDRYSIVNRDISLGYSEACDFLICQETLEHLENPDEFICWLYDLIKPGGSAYITAALNAAHSDHIYHFRDPLQLEQMLRAVGFQPGTLQEEFAPGSKPRLKTPSLAGYYCERP